MMRALARAAILALGLAACSAPEPIRIGFIGGLSNRTNDTGEAARNALMLAIEQRNEAGGIGGRRLEMLIADDGNRPETAREAMNTLIAARPEAVVGPFTSSMAEAILPLAEGAGMVLLSPVITSMRFVGKDDMLIRLNRSTRDNANNYAHTLIGRGVRRLAVALDVSNRAFSESWLTELRAIYPELGGTITNVVEFQSAAGTAFSTVAGQLLEASPDALLFIANAVDVARLAQQVRKTSATIPLAAVEWASSEQLLELGGRAVEGLLLAQSYRRDDATPRFEAFRKAYRDRFSQEPGYSAIATYDAATVLFDALLRRKSGEGLKRPLLEGGPYAGLQQEIRFDRFGDTTRAIHFAEIRDGRFVLVP
ncbi:MAG: ABC transporter substrate-binding protein [Thauera sp.]